MQLASASVMLDVSARTPKFRPVTMTEGEPQRGVFGAPREMTGASNVTAPALVPVTAATVTNGVICEPAPPEDKHVNHVPLIHDRVRHA